ncbi:hypothetical protein [Bacillus thuringiensis]|uniref:hypothetical protein n=1 Tax=Bacillus thuringiensis TaxID=1428 RepID=UPI0021D66FD3|nr:hypothetical protein [Bacillus thuringiensis]MCU7667348.1 hypothetical protein [Bacillus thuringiensis]
MLKKVLIGCAGVFGFLLLTAIISFSSIWTHRNEVVALEEGIKSQHVANKSDYDKMWKTFKEMAQVTDMQTDDIKKVYTDIITGRYDKDENVLVKMVQENNPQLNTGVYSKLQTQIAASREQFSNNQTKIADKVREYNTAVRKYVIMNALFRFEELDANKYVVTSERTEKTFETGKDNEINIKGE